MVSAPRCSGSKVGQEQGDSNFAGLALKIFLA